MKTKIEDLKYYEALERQIVKEATNNGVSFEEAALLRQRIKNEGLEGFALCEMLRSKLAEKQNRKK